MIPAGGASPSGLRWKIFVFEVDSQCMSCLHRCDVRPSLPQAGEKKTTIDLHCGSALLLDRGLQEPFLALRRPIAAWFAHSDCWTVSSGCLPRKHPGGGLLQGNFPFLVSVSRRTPHGTRACNLSHAAAACLGLKSRFLIPVSRDDARHGIEKSRDVTSSIVSGHFFPQNGPLSQFPEVFWRRRSLWSTIALFRRRRCARR
jgi:hypothetical protein